VLLTASMISSLFVFVVIVEFMNRRSLPPVESGFTANVDPIRYTFYAISIVLVLAVNVVRGFALKHAGPRDIEQLSARLTLVNVVTLGMADAPAIMGLVLYLGWRCHTDFYLLGLISLYLMIRHFPRYRNWESFVAGKMGREWTPGGPAAT
jgi:hypothetical protein